jgi:hypothetical protein
MQYVLYSTLYQEDKLKQTDKHVGGQNNQMAGKLKIHVTKINREDLSPTAFQQ